MWCPLSVCEAILAGEYENWRLKNRLSRTSWRHPVSRDDSLNTRPSCAAWAAAPITAGEKHRSAGMGCALLCVPRRSFRFVDSLCSMALQ